MTSLPPSSANLRGAVDLSSLVRPKVAPPAAASTSAATSAAAAAAPSLVVEGTDANFTGILDLSKNVPVVVELHSGEPSAELARIVTEYAGRIILATVNVAASPQLAQAFNATVAPTISAVVAGRPLALFEGELPEAEVRQVLDQLLTLAAQNGVTGSVNPDAAGAAAGSPEQPLEVPLPPHHQAAYDAIADGDYELAMVHYRTAIAQDPRDNLAVAGLAQVALLSRLAGTTAADIRAKAAREPTDCAAQLAVADLDVSGGHLEDAFARLLEIFPALDQAGKDSVRLRLLDFFEIAGIDDPRVIAGRRQLTMLLY